MKSNLVRLFLSLSALIVFAVVVWAGTSHFTAIETSGTLTVGTTATVGTSPVSSGGSAIVKTMIWELDSVGYAANHMIFTPERAITILRGELFVKGDALAGESTFVKLVTGAAEASKFEIPLEAAETAKSITTDANIPATACTLKTAINAGAYNGTRAKLIYWYTDDE